LEVAEINCCDERKNSGRGQSKECDHFAHGQSELQTRPKSDELEKNGELKKGPKKNIKGHLWGEGSKITGLEPQGSSVARSGREKNAAFAAEWKPGLTKIESGLSSLPIEVKRHAAQLGRNSKERDS